jgi:predicted NAD/FAD-dependent oxidoreductase
LKIMNEALAEKLATNKITLYDVVVVGAGIAGLAAARSMATQGKSVLVIDKGRRIGGRSATKRAKGFTFTHGAQFLTARHPEFQKVCDAAVRQGALTPWHFGGKTTFIGAPTMRNFAVFLGAGLTIMQSVEIDKIERRNDRFVFSDATGPIAHSTTAIITPPAPQTAALLRAIAPELAAAANDVVYAPCWTAMFGFAGRDHVPDMPHPVQFDEGPISWANWEHHRPGADPENHALTIQASPQWSAANLEDESEETATALLQIFCSAHNLSLPGPDFAACHRWRYAKVITAAAANAPRVSSCGRIAIAGDWLEGARIEGAYISGLTAATHLNRV